MPSRSPRKISRNFSKRTNTVQLYERVRDVVRDDYLTRENVTMQEGEFIRRDTLLTKITIRVYSCFIVFCRFRENKSARELDFYAGKPILFANMLVHVFDDGLSIVVSIPHCLSLTR